MKTIEERYKSYIGTVGAECFQPKNIGNTMKKTFIAGAKYEHEELMRWNSPECPPEDHREILVKVKNGYNIASYNPDKGYCLNGGFYTEIIGWREIHE